MSPIRHRQLFLLAIVCAMLAACAPQSLDQKTPVATAEMANRSKQSLGTLQTGRALYIAHCGRCHEHQLPASVSSEDWHVVAPGMAWNAGLNKSDERAVLAYLLAATSR
jgi:cytochrome c5